MSSIIIVILITLGTLFVLLSAIGLVRMPDTYMRISVNTKAATLGVGLILVGTAVFFNDLSTTSRALVIILFVFLTAPVSAHLIGRASYFMGVKLWKGSVMDDLRGKYQRNSHVLKSEIDDTPQNNIDHTRNEDDIVK
ncbi:MULTISPECIES: monovalent cation/H(+) antiporter subunit G [Salegentibacter]|jgi:multicomponent Na+:H+ antiporter subunit G|uniref:Multisubunit sodium/proton antiporter, MrpG subunit n=1 Tax=Salegentibacter agarivorans TaxID=345907 RepID=A0A1I2NT29_9FLAO|nr:MULTISPECIES: monovalent cation/H(+) antiporter subunit G [Salegentibacter]APS38344.1 sodium:proton antiporter [Salegentibacter sp. T436]MBO2543852.1 monovalent cation/H(+) antiporter subunit G [Salegentibacter sp. BDJ18]SFG05889.1 multisubunit sodium/proton antiporter, MrpG subunit [Salegentibacter agarivorans]|tara:strand:+ start:1394 stop:1807 length:414 start_codon:yes stop_codon:yes gene_type:complete